MEIVARLEAVPRTDARQPGMPRCRFVIASVAVTDNDRADVLTIKYVVETHERAKIQTIEFPINTKPKVGDGITGCSLVCIGILDINLVANNPLDCGMKTAGRMFPDQFAEQRLCSHTGQTVTGIDRFRLNWKRCFEGKGFVILGIKRGVRNAAREIVCPATIEGKLQPLTDCRPGILIGSTPAGALKYNHFVVGFYMEQGHVKAAVVTDKCLQTRFIMGAGRWLQTKIK